MFEYPITIERTVTVDLDASDWELYTASRDCSEAARALNVAASEGLGLPTPTEAFAHWEAVADRLAHFGAADSEPRQVMRDLVAQVFGRIGTWSH